MRAILRGFADRRYHRYLFVSLLCLVLDLSVFAMLLRTGTMPAFSAASGYLAGTAAHWMLSTRLVFEREAIAEGSMLFRQKLSFLASALCGTAMTVSVVNVSVAGGLDASLAKILAVGVSFQFVWLLRRHLVFA